MDTVKQTFNRFVRDEEGLTATEYAILFVVVLAVIVTGAGNLATAIETLFQDANKSMRPPAN